MRFFALGAFGRQLPCRGRQDIVVEDAATADPSGLGHRPVLRFGGKRIPRSRPGFAAAGATVIDNSSAWRMDPMSRSS